eukprot:CAMPEP_0168719008 /NCGR_PEP_ID=MMETSP0724-20121128/815_1 /TAXON_ID=265536 /ORGANISM="Amphiprora sp., Strain CCMP467" /LENGTH=359 /DNA_ID=CAMNT_0008765545 /DNA_START=320 /DNA_END=1399 /DNA_ORIENTATION=+
MMKTSSALRATAAKVGGPKLLQPLVAAAAENPAAVARPACRLLSAATSLPRGSDELSLMTKMTTVPATLSCSALLPSHPLPSSLLQERLSLGLKFSSYVEAETRRRFKKHFSSVVLPELVLVANQWEDEQIWIKHMNLTDSIGLFDELRKVTRTRKERQLRLECTTHFSDCVLVELQRKVMEMSKFTDEDEKAINQYTSKNFWTFNRALRLNVTKTMSQVNGARLAAIRKAFHKAQRHTLFQGEVYRGCCDTPQDVYDSLVEGATFKDPAFLSASQKTSIAMYFCDMGRQTNITLYQIESKTGVKLDQFSPFGEKEVAFSPGTLFRIDQIDDGLKFHHPDGRPFTARVVHMTEIPVSSV